MSQPDDDEDFPSLPLDASAGPAHHITRAKSDAMVQRALAGAGFVAAADTVGTNAVGLTDAEDSARQNSRDLRSRRAIKTSYLAAAILVACATVGSASAAVLWYASVRGTAPVTTNAIPRGERVASSRRAPTPGKVEAPPSTVEQATEPPTELPALAPALPLPSATVRASEDLLVEGSRLRAAKRWQRADDAYSDALHAAPGSQTAYVAQVASAALRLEHLGNPRGALRRYRSALRQHPNGPLSEEILFGIAEAQRALGDAAAEQRALQLFLRAHPTSPLAAQARARLQ